MTDQKFLSFNTRVVPAEIPGLIRRFIEITSDEPWKNRFAGMDSQIARYEGWAQYFFQTFEIEITLREIFDNFLVNEVKRFSPSSFGQMLAMCLIIMVPKTFQRLSEKGKRKLRGQILSGLEKDHGLLPLAFEMHIAKHLLDSGYELQFCDLESMGRPDFIAKTARGEVEIECKSFSSDKGAPIHRRNAYYLGEITWPSILKSMKEVRAGKMLRVILPDRLPRSQEKLSVLSRLIERALFSRSSLCDSEAAELLYSEFHVGGTLFSSPAEVPAKTKELDIWVRENFGLPNSSMVMAHWTKGSVVLVSLESKRATSVISRMKKDINEACGEQLTQDRAGIVCVNMSGLSSADLYELWLEQESQRPNAFSVVAGQIFAKESRHHVYAINFTAPGKIRHGEERLGGETYSALMHESMVHILQNSQSRYLDQNWLDIFKFKPVKSNIIICP